MPGTGDIGANDAMPPPGVAQAEQLDRMHHLVCREIQLISQAATHIMQFGWVVIGAMLLGMIEATVLGAFGNDWNTLAMRSAATAILMCIWTWVIAALYARRIRRTVNLLEVGLAEWEIHEVTRRLG